VNDLAYVSSTTHNFSSQMFYIKLTLLNELVMYVSVKSCTVYLYWPKLLNQHKSPSLKVRKLEHVFRDNSRKWMNLDKLRSKYTNQTLHSN